MRYLPGEMPLRRYRQKIAVRHLERVFQNNVRLPGGIDKEPIRAQAHDHIEYHFVKERSLLYEDGESYY